MRTRFLTPRTPKTFSPLLRVALGELRHAAAAAAAKGSRDAVMESFWRPSPDGLRERPAAIVELASRRPSPPTRPR